jgi:hypothetical protein
MTEKPEVIKQGFIKDQARLGILKTTYCQTKGQEMNKHIFLHKQVLIPFNQLDVCFCFLC